MISIQTRRNLMGIRFSKFSNRKDNKTEVIGIVGVGRGVGTTHLGLLLANYLQGVWGRKTAVLEWNNHGDFSRIRKQCTGQMEVKECFRIQKVDYYSQAESSQLMRCMETGYQEVVIDFGTIREEIFVEFMRCNTVWAVVSFSEWQIDAFWEFAEAKESKRNRSWQFFSAFGSEESRKEWNKRRKPEVLQIPFSADAFTITRPLMGWMEKALEQSSFSGNVSQKNLQKRTGKA